MGGASSESPTPPSGSYSKRRSSQPAPIRATSKKLGLKTEASTRFERGMDRTAPPRAMARALRAARADRRGQARPVPSPTSTLARISRSRCSSSARGSPDCSAWKCPTTTSSGSCSRLGFEVESPRRQYRGAGRPAAGMYLPAVARRHAPPSRSDRRSRASPRLRTSADDVPRRGAGAAAVRSAYRARPAVRTALLGMGFSEAITFAFIEAAAAEPFLEWPTRRSRSRIPLSEKFAVMRPSLLPGLVDAVSHNRRHGRPDVRLFEIGTRFSPDGETRGAGFAWTGLATADHWSGARRAVDFADHQGRRRAAGARCRRSSPTFAEIEVPYLVTGRAADLIVDGRVDRRLRPTVTGGRRKPRSARRG